MDYREELFKALTAGIEGTMRDKHIDALVEVCRAAWKEGYNAGLEDGHMSNGTLEEKVKEAYENGANDVWECVNKMYSKMDSPVVSSIFGVKYYDVFEKFTASEAMAKVKEYEEKQKEPVFKIGDRVKTLVDKDNLGTEIFPTGTIGEVVGINGDSIAVKGDAATGYGYYRNDTLEIANDVILVGDEVYRFDNHYGVVTAVWEVGETVKTERMTQSGKLACDDARHLHRTGRRFPEIANVLKKMQEGDK